MEFALIGPFIFLLFFAFWEWSRVEMIRQATTTACFEAARVGTLPSSTVDDMDATATKVLANYMVSDANITSTIDKTRFRATSEVTVPLNENLWGIRLFFRGQEFSASYELQNEVAAD